MDEDELEFFWKAETDLLSVIPGFRREATKNYVLLCY